MQLACDAVAQRSDGCLPHSVEWLLATEHPCFCLLANTATVYTHNTPPFART